MRITHVPDRSKADGRAVEDHDAVGIVIYPFSPSRTISTIVCKSPVNEGDPITADGRIASSSDLSTFGKLVGLALSTENEGFPVDVVTTGRAVHNGWTWSIGDSVFLGELSLSSEAPTTGYLQQVGTSDGPNSLIVSIQPAIKL